MGRNYNATPLHWTEITKEKSDKFKEKALKAFIEYFLAKGPEHQVLFGDEMEQIFVVFEENCVKLSLKAGEVIPELSERWQWEEHLYQAESTPLQPYRPHELLKIESSLRSRRLEVKALLGPNEGMRTLCAWPRFGCGDYTSPQLKSTEKLVTLQTVSPSDRCRYLHQNSFLRDIGPILSIPVYQDQKTEDASIELDSYEPVTIFCALQITIQARNFTEARTLYDQLAVMCPLLVALSAAAPCFKGLLLDTDCRNALQISNDGLERSTGLPSRWSSVRHYISERGEEYNDVWAPVNEAAQRELLAAGVDEGPALHAAFRLNYDPVILYDDNQHVNAAEAMTGTVWQLIKLKIPENGTDWRIEFRPMDTQISDFENASLIVFVFLLSRAILHYQLDFLVPISELFANTEKAMKRDAILNEKLIFQCSDSEGKQCEKGLLTVDEILNGNDQFPGIMHYISRYLKEESEDGLRNELDRNLCNENTNQDSPSLPPKHSVDEYLDFLSRRATGAEKTCARKIRDFVIAHPDYQLDSRVSERIQYDLLRETEQWE